MQRSYGSDRGPPNRGGGRYGRRSGPRHVILDGPRETGILVAIKEGFGFVECVDRRDRIFFHFSALKTSPRDLEIGSELEFNLGENFDTGKLNLVDAVLLSPGSVKFDVISEEKYTAFVEFELGKAPVRILRRLVPDHRDVAVLSDQWNGNAGVMRIDKDTSDQTDDFIPFFEYDNVDHLYPGDIVSMRVATDKRTGLRRAHEVEVVKRKPVEQGTGFICSLKNGFGFIDCCEVRRELFFHFSSVQPGIDPERDLFTGAEVEYVVREDARKKMCGFNIKIVPRGTVSFERDVCDVQGKVTHVPRRVEPESKRSPPMDGRFELVEEVNDESILPFCWWDFDDRVLPGGVHIGDKFTCTVVCDKRSGKLRAGHMILVDLADEPRLCGVVVSTSRDSLIECSTMEGPLFFHQNDVLPGSFQGTEKENDSIDDSVTVRDVRKSDNFSIGDEVEFVVFPKTSGARQARASRLSKLETGSVQFDEIVQENIRGTVIAGCGIIGRSRRIGPVHIEPRAAGEIELDVPTASIEKIKFMSVDGPGDGLLVNDVVEFVIAKSKQDGQIRATNIVLVDRPPEKREKGIISAWKTEFGFIDNGDPEKQLFFHVSEVSGIDVEGDITGTCVEFTITQDKRGRKNAVRIEALPTGAVSFSTIDETLRFGHVTSLWRTERDRDGVIEVCGEEDEESWRDEDRRRRWKQKTYIKFAQNDVVACDDAIKSGVDVMLVGDRVQFCLSIDDRNGHRRAAQVRRLADKGVVSTKGDTLIICPVGNRRRIEFAQFKQEDADQELKSGDTVEFDLVVLNGSHHAMSISKIGEAEYFRPVTFRPRSEPTTPTRATGARRRVPKGPDGTIGFTAGRGRRLIPSVSDAPSPLSHPERISTSVSVPVGLSSVVDSEM